MSERQAKRLRRAQRAHILKNEHKLERGEPVAQAASKAAAIVRDATPRLNHRERGAVGSRLGSMSLLAVALSMTGRR